MAERSILAQALPWKPVEPLQGPLQVSIDAFFPIPKSWSMKRQQAAERGELRPTGRPDADNVMKNLDALNGIFWRDDAQIVDAHITKWYGANPRMEFKIQTIQSAPNAKAAP